MKKISLSKFYRKYETGLEIFGIIMGIVILCLFCILMCMPRSEYPLWLKNKEEQRIAFLEKKISYYTNAAQFYTEINAGKAVIYYDSAKVVKREIDSLSIFVIQKNEL